MKERVIELEADSLEEARKALYTDDRIVLQEIILCREKVGTIEDIADTVEEAVTKARSRIPAEAKIEAQKTIVAPKRTVLQVAGDDEEHVWKEFRPQKAAILEAVSLHKKARQGFLGFLKTPNIYEVVVWQQAIVEVRFRVRAKLQAKVQDYLAGDLLQSIQDVRRRDAQWAEVLQLLNPKDDPDMQTLLAQLQELPLSSALEAIENVCREREKANWLTLLKAAHRQAFIVREQELRERKVKLRRLDVEIADTFVFYTAIDWSYKGPTGIPRCTQEYDHHRLADKRLRESIPRYSTDKKAFRDVERMIDMWNLHETYFQFLLEEGQDEATSTLEQKCIAILNARKLQIKQKTSKPRCSD